MVPREAVTVTGTLATLEDVGTSGMPVHCRFCPHCGAPVLTDCAALPATMIIKAGTIHDNEWFRPSAEIFIRHRRPWLEPVPGAAQFEGNPPL